MTPIARTNRTIDRTAEQLLDNALADLNDYALQSVRTMLKPETRTYAAALAELHHALVRDFVPVSTVDLSVSPDEIIGTITVHCALEDIADAACLADFSPEQRTAGDGTVYVHLHRAADDMHVDLIIPPARTDGAPAPDVDHDNTVVH